jgi:hypothetical protein
MRRVILILIILFGLTIHSYGLRIQRPRHFTYPLSESDVSELNSILEEIWLVQQGRYEADAVPSVKSNANTGEFWINTPENAFEYIVDGTVYQISGGAPSGGATWGTITGTVTAQTDLAIYALDSDLASYVPTSRTVNGKALSGNITLNVTSDIDASIYALDTDLNVYAPVNNTVLTGVSNATYLTVSRDTTLASVSGNVGIGDAGPINRLTLKSTGGSTTPFGLLGSTGFYLVNMQQLSSDAGAIRVYDASNNVVTTISGSSTGNTYFNSGANVGIGTAAPRQKLEVDGFVYVVDGAIGVGTSMPRGSLDVRSSPGTDGYIYGNGAYITGITGGSGLSYAAVMRLIAIKE